MKALLGILLLIAVIYALTSGKDVSPKVSNPIDTTRMVTGEMLNPDPAVVERRRRQEVLASISLKNFSWRSEFSVMTASFTFVNPSDYDVKDLKVRCTHSAPSGTKIDENTRTVFEVVSARSSKAIREFNMGFVHSQATRSGCQIIDAVVGDFRAPPPKPSPKPAGKPLSISPQ